MRPVLFELNGLKVHSYGAMLVLGFLCAILIGRSRASKFGFDKNAIADAGLWALLPGILGARLFFVVQEWSYYKDHPGEIFTKFEGLTSFGGLAFGLLGIVAFCRFSKKPLLPFLDLASGPFLVATAVGRLGCLLNGCCYGGSCTLPWGITVAGKTGLYHPAQMYDALLNVAAFGILILFEKRQRGVGASIGLALVLHGLARFIYEFWRAGTTSTYMGSLPITDAQAVAGLISLNGLVLMMRAKPKTTEAVA
ncbi:MAG TPA: prolipoprotein diacylglyceryl transferase [Fimbriimonadaceae bacterium]|nr:prolipoprotein diacylglyceryl transferase [Fimbriimonadaceae bacterium]